MQLRPYQRSAIDDLQRWLFDEVNEGLHPIIDASVGAGKSVMIAKLIQELIDELPDLKVLMLVHVKELLEQNFEKLKAVWPTAPAGLYCGSAKSYQIEQITFATIQSIYKEALKLGKVHLIIVDECHLINTDAEGTYRKLIDVLLKFNPQLRVIGFTGTPFRGNGVWLWEGKEPLFHGVCSKVGMTKLLEDGYLSPLVPAKMVNVTHTDGVGKDSTGDYKVKELAAIMDDQAKIEAAVVELIETAREHNRKSWLVFTVTVDHAQHVLDELLGHGVNAAMITGKTPKAQREQTIAEFKAGKITALVNVAVLTTGFDAPNTDLIANLRPTISPVLYVQIAGRGMRLAEGKQNCLWLDFTDTTERMGPVDKVKGRSKGKGKKGSAILKTCIKCEEQMAAGLKYCPACGTEQPANPLKVMEQSESAVLSQQVLPRVLHVTNWFAEEHMSKKGNLTVKVTYLLSGLQPPSISRWLVFEGSSFAKQFAHNFWLGNGGALPIPDTTDEALKRFNELTMPDQVLAKQEGQYWQVLQEAS